LLGPSASKMTHAVRYLPAKETHTKLEAKQSRAKPTLPHVHGVWTTASRFEFAVTCSATNMHPFNIFPSTFFDSLATAHDSRSSLFSTPSTSLSILIMLMHLSTDEAVQLGSLGNSGGGAGNANVYGERTGCRIPLLAHADPLLASSKCSHGF
jgi:hypothetical protein